MSDVISQFVGYAVAQECGYSHKYPDKIRNAVSKATGTYSEIQPTAELIAKRALLIGMISREQHGFVFQKMNESLNILTELTGSNIRAYTQKDVDAVLDVARSLPS